MVSRRHEPALAKLTDWEELLPALEQIAEIATPQDADAGEVADLWLALIRWRAFPSALADDSLRELWDGAAKDGVVPDALPSHAGDVPLQEVFVTNSSDLARRARTCNRVVVSLGDDAFKLWLEKGAKNLSELLQPEWSALSGPVTMLIDVFPDLANVLKPDARDTARCQPVSDLQLRVGDAVEQIPCLMWAETILVDSRQLGEASRTQRLKLLLDEVAAAGWLNDEPAVSLRCLADADVDLRRAKVASGGSLAERLWLAVGERREPLMRALGDLAEADFIKRCAPLDLAELTLAHLGPMTLSTLKQALDEEGLKPPTRWNGVEARTFVASIGFRDEFAASPEARREPEEYISGPIELPPLHDFQEEVLKSVGELLVSGEARRRAVISLPTGAGKTRVTVEAAVKHVLKPQSDRRGILWIAQTDELCEQAVQAFRQVWLADRAIERHGLKLLRPADAAEYVARCAEHGIAVLGIDGFRVDGVSIQPMMEHSVDLSLSSAAGDRYGEAAEFLASRLDSNLWFEVVVEAP